MVTSGKKSPEPKYCLLSIHVKLDKLDMADLPELVHSVDNKAEAAEAAAVDVEFLQPDHQAHLDPMADPEPMDSPDLPEMMVSQVLQLHPRRRDLLAFQSVQPVPPELLEIQVQKAHQETLDRKAKTLPQADKAHQDRQVSQDQTVNQEAMDSQESRVHQDKFMMDLRFKVLPDQRDQTGLQVRPAPAETMANPEIQVLREIQEITEDQEIREIQAVQVKTETLERLEGRDRVTTVRFQELLQAIKIDQKLMASCVSILIYIYSTKSE